MLKPKLLDTLKGYTSKQFRKDAMAGIIVGIVALPLAIAFAIASGVTPEKGLYTAVIAGFIISVLGGSRVQIGGPTGAFIVIVFGIVQQYGVNGLIIATLIAGVMLIVMGFAKLGSVIKFIPHPLIVGFTSGIALLIFSSQIKDFLGLQMGTVPADFIEKWESYGKHLFSINIYAVIIAVATVIIILLSPKITRIIPGSLFAIMLSTVAVYLFHLPVETIGSKFGNIPSSLPTPVLPHLDFATIKALVQPAFTIALLAGIESLLSAVVADGIIGGNHRSNMELVAQGPANISSALFGGIPATGAIARTVTNIKNGGRTPVAGIIHAITLLLIMLFVGKWVALIPLASLAGILVVVAYNMSEWESFVAILKSPKSDVAVLLVSFLLTVFIDLTVAIEVGMVLAAFLFMRKMVQFSGVNIFTKEMEDGDIVKSKEDIENFSVPKNVEVFEIKGPMFFAAAYKFKEAMRVLETPPRVLIIRMRQVPMIDATGIKTLKDVLMQTKQTKTKLILSGVAEGQVLSELQKSRLVFAIGKANVLPTFTLALERAKQYILQSDIEAQEKKEEKNQSNQV
ncbi:MAG: STAS domain-containing protein [Chitinophagaceae bacterium]|nr:STAS domain-containing protein [Chitinophagaceae bacterium]